MICSIVLSGAAGTDEARIATEILIPSAIYILQCSGGTYYTGLTKDLDGRVHEHEIGANPESYTFSRRPVKLVWNVITESYIDAFQWEHRIKGWSRAKKEALIRGDIEGIHAIVKNERKQRENIKRNHRAERKGLSAFRSPVDEAQICKIAKSFWKAALRLHSSQQTLLVPLSAIKHYDYKNHPSYIYHPVRRASRQGL